MELKRRLRRRILGVRPESALRPIADVPSPCDDPAARQELDRIVAVFVHGYNTAIECADAAEIAHALDGTVAESARDVPIRPADLGFAYEGAAMGVTLLDLVSPVRGQPTRGGRLEALLELKGELHPYMIHVGAGWAAARLRMPPDRLFNRLNPLFQWLAADGYGFAFGCWQPGPTITKQRVPVEVRGYARRAFDHGLGRCLWFHAAGDMDWLVARVRSFAPQRQRDLYSGLGLASAYAGGAHPAKIEYLRSKTPDVAAELGQGAAFAAKVRERAGNPAPHTESVCRQLCRRSAHEAAAVTDHALPDHASFRSGRDGLPPSFSKHCPGAARITRTEADVTSRHIARVTAQDRTDVPPYEQWRQRIQRSIVAEGIPA